MQFKIGQAIRRKSWNKHQYLVITGFDYYYDSDCLTPYGYLHHRTGNIPFHVKPNNHDDWEIVF